ncbi:MAG: alpha-glucan family phosphorylase, partial [Acidimicrobiia bacterium]
RDLASDGSFMAALSAGLADRGESSTKPTIAYYSPEFGLSDLLPLYAGGLGVLAGDHLKACSDRDLPLAGVGLFYRQGAYHQRIEGLEQVEYYEPIEPGAVGAVDTGLVVGVPLGGRDVSVHVWRLDVGRVALILLDTDLAPNSSEDRTITDRLYLGSERHRIDQEMVLGVGGARALAALGWDIAVHHLNEGHAGFVTLELIDRLIQDGDILAAVEKVRGGTVFTTHTPVPAGISRVDKNLLLPYLARWAERWDVDVSEVWALGEDPDDPARFNMAVFCLRTSGAANGVSELHGEVSRSLFSAIDGGPRIGHVTNGVHARTWTADPAQDLFDEILGPEWADGDPDAWVRASRITDEQIEHVRSSGARRLGELVALHGGELDPSSLIVGFARRFAPYKRASLVLRDFERLVAMLADDVMPVHFLFAGKAHPQNDDAQELVSEIVRFSQSSDANRRFTFLPDYDMSVASHLVEGCDVWLNNPVRLHEASGTSGQKVALNGGLNCSVLDGWWAEMYDGANGWAIPTSDGTSPEAREVEEAAAVIDQLLSARKEYFEDRPGFLARVRHGWVTLGPRVTAARMVSDYERSLYEPARRRVGRRLDTDEDWP